MDLTVYTKNLKSDLLPSIVKRFNDYGITIEFHPEFKFNINNDNGFLPVKFKLNKGISKHYDQYDFYLLSGFEIYFSPYDYQEDLKSAQETTQLKTGFFSKLFKTNKPKVEFIENEEIDNLLKSCNQYVNLHFSSRNKSELRISLLFATILIELTNGVIYDTYHGRFLNTFQALETIPIEILEYENSFSVQEFSVDRFEKWS